MNVFLTLGISLAITSVAATSDLTSVAQLRELTPEQADAHIPVQIRGVVTYAEHQFNMLYVQDETGGTYVGGPITIVNTEDPDNNLNPGDLVEISGVSNRGKFVPHIDSGKSPVNAEVVGTAPLPPPVRPNAEGLLDPKLHNQWVEVEAYVVGMSLRGRRWLSIELLSGGRRLHALVLGKWGSDEIPDWKGSDIRVRGVYGATFNDERQLTGANLLVSSIGQIEVIDHGLKQAFAQPPLEIEGLRQFQPIQVHRVRIKGVVTWVSHHKGFYVSNGRDAAWVVPANGEVVTPGDYVDLVGFSRIDGSHLEVEDAVVRKAEEQEPDLAVHKINDSQTLSSDLHGQLVRIEGSVVDCIDLPDGRVVVLKHGDSMFEARLQNQFTKDDAPNLLATASVTGVYESLETGYLNEPVIHRLLLRSPNDVVIVRPAPWLTLPRVAGISIGLMAVLIAASLWGVTLQRTVHRQAELITQQVERQRIAEERTRIGRDLHDTLEQHLTGIALQLDTALAATSDSDARIRNSLELASAMLAHSRQEARESVWGLMSNLLQERGLCVALEELAHSLSTDETNVRFQQVGKWQPLSNLSETQLYRIAQEAVTNALKHSSANHVDIMLGNCDESLELRISDNGKGFDLSDSNAQNGIHFGLEGMRERATKLGAKFSLESKRGVGTSVSIVLGTPKMQETSK